MVRVVVIGGGNAGLCSAIAAVEAGATVTLLERAPESQRGGNSRFTAGAMRVAFNTREEVADLVGDFTEALNPGTQLGPTRADRYAPDEFYDELMTASDLRADPDLVWALATGSLETLRWLRAHGVRFVPSWQHSARTANQLRFYAGVVVEVSGGGEGLVSALYDRAVSLGVDVRYASRAVDVRREGRGALQVHVSSRAGTDTLITDGLVLASGGFEANAEWRARYLGPGWELAKVRGTRFNTGDGIEIGLRLGAQAYGHWSGCHAVTWDFNAPEYGDLGAGDAFQKYSFIHGVIVNELGERFVDEGRAVWNQMYAMLGAEIMRQPRQSAWQVFDARGEALLRPEYRSRRAARVTAAALEGLADEMRIDRGRFTETITRFNAAIDSTKSFDPSQLDGLRTHGLIPPKSNWANAISVPPFSAYHVTCGITFTYGGLRVDQCGRVLDLAGEPVVGVCAAGELVGGLYYFNCPGGTGLTAGAFFGRRAGYVAATGNVGVSPMRA